MRKQRVYFGYRRKAWDQAYKVVANGTMVSVTERIARQRNINQMTLGGLLSALFSRVEIVNPDWAEDADQPTLSEDRLDRMLGAEGIPHIPGLHVAHQFSIYGQWYYELASSDPAFPGTQMLHLVSQDADYWVHNTPGRLTRADVVKRAMLNVRLVNDALNDELDPFKVRWNTLHTGKHRGHFEVIPHEHPATPVL